MELSPKKIINEYSQNRIDKLAATKLLLSLIENTDNNKTRIECINQLDNIRVGDERSFEVLEHLLISDSNDLIRNSAAITLRNNFLDRILEPMKWSLAHDESPLCLNTIYLILIDILHNLARDSDPFASSSLLTEIEGMNNKDFVIGFETICRSKNIEDFSNPELADVLINYFSIIYLEKSFWRLKSKLNECKIIELDFIFKGLTRLPDVIKNLTHLKTLILRYNQLTQLPDWISVLRSLEILNVNVNNLNTLPEEIGYLKSLKELLLWKNELSHLPSSLGNLINLETLNLRLNQLKTLPDTIGRLTSLKELNLHDNQLVNLPNSIAFLDKLEVLNLSWNNIQNLPDSFGSLSSLKALDLERNELTELPESIKDLKSLEYLNLSDNKLTTIPKGIGNLTSLQYLNLSRNELDSIPKSLKSLTSLKKLYLGENYIRTIPKYLRKLECIEDEIQY
ncbi:MAG: leucine-rich repeat domain-containing protein [Promethearchaeota archaeon]|jgi:Leucine-rich repeat (LRR) protein